VEAIQVIGLPRNNKEIQSFLGKIVFLRRSMPNFVEVVKYLTNMLKNDSELKWSVEAGYPFYQVKKSLGEAPVLEGLDYSKFLIFSFASNNTLVVFLLQRIEEKQEKPIAFFSKSLIDSELKYNIMEK
jgi:hypothetical protein